MSHPLSRTIGDFECHSSVHEAGPEVSIFVGPMDASARAHGIRVVLASDGLWDAEELLLGTDPIVQDTAGDGLTDGAELDLFNTDPLNADSDEDGVSDALELLFPPTNSGCPGDINSDGAVSVADLLLLLNTFGQAC